MTKKDIGERIKIIRRFLNLNQETVAQKLQISIQTLSRYENGMRSPTSLFLQDFGKTYHINANWLLYGKGEMFLQDPEVLEIVQDKQQRLTYLFGKIEKLLKEMIM